MSVVADGGDLEPPTPPSNANAINRSPLGGIHGGRGSPRFTTPKPVRYPTTSAAPAADSTTIASPPTASGESTGVRPPSALRICGRGDSEPSSCLFAAAAGAGPSPRLSLSLHSHSLYLNALDKAAVASNTARASAAAAAF